VIILTHQPESCSQCGKRIVPKRHPHTDPDYVNRPVLRGLPDPYQWTCGCATWGPANGSTLNPFDLDSVP
jgi:hypothetical protein